MNSASSRRAAVSGQPPAVWGGRARRPGGVRARRPGGVRAPIAPRWHPAGMSQMAARYDLRARSYARCWAPVLAPSAIALLDVVEPVVGAAPVARLLDAGTGSAPLALAATRRWPHVHVTGLDVSAGMLAVARAAAVAALGPAELVRLSLV